MSHVGEEGVLRVFVFSSVRSGDRASCDSGARSPERHQCSVGLTYKHCLPCSFWLNSLRNIVKPEKKNTESMFDDSG